MKNVTPFSLEVDENLAIVGVLSDLQNLEFRFDFRVLDNDRLLCILLIYRLLSFQRTIFLGRLRDLLLVAKRDFPSLVGHLVILVFVCLRFLQLIDHLLKDVLRRDC